MRILILGGTAFVGRHIVEACLARGHTVTLLHRGLSDPGAFPNVEHILGDRGTDLGKLRGRKWDVVIDTSGYEVPSVREAAQSVAHPDVHYVFVSSISVYSDLTRTDESAPVHTIAEPERAKLSLDTYGALKAACEQALESVLAGRVQSVRAGLILGPHDYDDRFAYWLRRIARGGEVLAPGNPDARVQFIDVRDLAAWIVRCAERRITGTFNATGPGEPITMRSLLETIRDVTGADARFTWIPDEILLAHNVGSYSEMPFWLPANLGHLSVDIRRALGEGLVHRPVVETVRDTWTWLQASWDAEARVRAHRKLRVRGGMSPEREQQILAAAGAVRPS
jgi:2'-hydroxyisoflavone reductase